jgi:hypothetical protein
MIATEYLHRLHELVLCACEDQFQGALALAGSCIHGKIDLITPVSRSQPIRKVWSIKVDNQPERHMLRGAAIHRNQMDQSTTRVQMKLHSDGCVFCVLALWNSQKR